MIADPGALAIINSHPISGALAMLILNIGGKYVDFGLTKGQEEWIMKLVTREVFVLAVVFVATKDLLLSILITLVVTILACYVLNEESRLCPFAKDKDSSKYINPLL